MVAPRIFVVTGANKGIGYGVVKGLAGMVLNSTIYLTARNETLGKESLKKVNEELGDKRKAEIRFHQLDITDRQSAKNFANYLQNEHNGFDVLINNAGFAFKNNATEPAVVQARGTIGVNYEGTKQTSEILFPLIRNGGRVVNVCSQMGMLHSYYSDQIKAKLSNPMVTVEDIDEFTRGYIKACEEGNRIQKGYPESAYRISKAAEISLTVAQARELKKRNILVNGCCPGYVGTDMTSHKGPLTIEEGADTIIYLATLEGDGPTGKFFYLRKPVDWIDGN